MPTPSTTRGKCVARRRLARGLSQEALAQLCGCSLRTIQRIEASENVGMSQRLIETLRDRLAMPLEELVNGKRSTRRA